jgi:uncharacterized Zn finger protein
VRESVELKGRRYLTEGRLHVLSVDVDRARATCRGNGETYCVGCDAHGWYCTCPARGRCAHLVALMLVVDAVPCSEPARSGAS